jgi:DNA-directed RNA polymerase specialized sigma subunit
MAALKRSSAKSADKEKAGGKTPVRVRLRHIEDGLLVLNERERLVLALRYYEKLSQPEIASVLRIGTKEVKRLEEKAVDGVVKYLSDRSKG